MSASLVRVPASGWPALAGIVQVWNRRADGGVHCLHAAHGADVAAHAAELAALPCDEAAFWVLEDGAGAAVGVVGCEFDRGAARAWLRGPLGADSGALDLMLPVVGPALESALPEIRCFDAFAEAGSVELNRWYAAAGYLPMQLHTVLQAPIGEVPDGPQAARRATACDLAAVWELHQALFPSTYLDEADFRRGLDAADRALIVAASGDDTAPSGYAFVQDDPAAAEAYIDYLGVVEAGRGRGFGRTLLGAAARWGAAHGRDRLGLTVREDRHRAVDLYRQAGFVQVSAGRHWRRSVGLAMQVVC